MSGAWPLDGITVFERGWLSSNNVLVRGEGGAASALIDTGYSTHSAQTVALVRHALGDEPLGEVLNTHLHSDHCGGNAALQAAFGCGISIPASEAEAVAAWDMSKLTYAATGQVCDRFMHDSVLHPGSTRVIAGRQWQVLAAPGHDPQSLVFYEPEQRVLVSADALWENGFGVVFPELEGVSAFDEVRATLDLIAGLKVNTVIPGHGRPFHDVGQALELAYSRLESFVRDPVRHGWYSGKALLKFHLLEVRQEPVDWCLRWLRETPYFGLIHQRYFADQPAEDWCLALLHALERSDAVRIEGGEVLDV